MCASEFPKVSLGQSTPFWISMSEIDGVLEGTLLAYLGWGGRDW